MGKEPKIDWYLKSTTATKKTILMRISFGYSEEQNLFTDDQMAIINATDAVERYKVLSQLDNIGVSPTKLTKTVYKPIIVSSELSIPLPFWNATKKEATGIYKGFNSRLKELKESIEKLYKFLVESGCNITPDYLKQQIKQNIFKKGLKGIETITTKNSKTNIIATVPDVFTDYIDWKVNDWKSNSPRVDYRAYGRFKTWVIKFESDIYKKKIKISELSTETLKLFVQFIITSKKKDGSNYKLNYLNDLKKQWKTFINELTSEDDIQVNVNLKKKFMLKKVEEEDDFALTQTHIEKLLAIEWDLSDKDELKQSAIADLLIIGTNCGYRYSDLKNVKLLEEDGEYFFRTTSTKPKIKVKIPVFNVDLVKGIFDKWNGNIPTYSDGEFNREIKAIFLKAKITDQVEMCSTNPQTNKLEKKCSPIWKEVSSKQCRKTFATWLIIKWQVPLYIAMTFTGHKSERSFRNYVRISEEQFHQNSMLQLKALKRLQVA